MIDPVISSNEIAGHDGPIAIADVRWYLDEPRKGEAEYDASHIPNAVHIHLEDHLSAHDGPGRHPLPTREAFAATMGELGLGDEHLIVAYDDRSGAIAARLWWMLRDIGHDRVRVLDGGIEAWTAAGMPLETTTRQRPSAIMTVRDPLTLQLDGASLQRRLGEVVLLDARAAERYRGDEEPIDPVAGHIPTAKSAPTEENLDGTGLFLPPETLRALFESLGVEHGLDTVVYCGSGVSACQDALAMVRAGLPEPILYPGSWSDWSGSGGTVATGNEPGATPH